MVQDKKRKLKIKQREHSQKDLQAKIPTAVDGKEMGAVELVEYLNKLGGANGIGLLE